MIDRERIEAIVIAAFGAAIPVAIAAYNINGWLAEHRELLELVRETCQALTSGG